MSVLFSDKISYVWSHYVATTKKGRLVANWNGMVLDFCLYAL